MNKVAIIIAPGFEEGEALTIADILKRANISCDLIGIQRYVEGGHHIIVQCDDILDETLIDYDMVILPGGYEGVDTMLHHQQLLDLLVKMNKLEKYICAMCAAPVVLAKINLLVDKKYTAYQGYDQKINQGQYLDNIVVVDHNIITGRGPATVYAFAYKIVEVLNGDALAVKNKMLYYHAFDKEEK